MFDQEISHSSKISCHKLKPELHQFSCQTFPLHYQNFLMQIRSNCQSSALHKLHWSIIIWTRRDRYDQLTPIPIHPYVWKWWQWELYQGQVYYLFIQTYIQWISKSIQPSFCWSNVCLQTSKCKWDKLPLIMLPISIFPS